MSFDKDMIMTDPQIYRCVNCHRPETEIPLVNLRYNGRPEWICSQCFPILIHEPQALAGKLAGAEKFKPAAHHH
jgi:hypothetical protein